MSDRLLSRIIHDGSSRNRLNPRLSDRAEHVSTHDPCSNIDETEAVSLKLRHWSSFFARRRSSYMAAFR
jgi:hypothetical protein